mmetsp:Transcript_36105/g.144330  ORF Transcript_36105/g.144330 Transcript_36105/m.144330 type:complete len:215 (-) Transcript_36105:375-1019(-)
MEEMKGSDDGEIANGPVEEESNDVLEVESEYDSDLEADEAREAKEEGNRLYGLGEWTSSIDSYTKALRCRKVEASERAVYYCNRAAARLKISDNEGVVSDCTKALKSRPDYEKALVRRKTAHVNLTNYGPALDDAKELLKTASSSERTSYISEISRLERLKLEKEEKQKQEAIEQLKEVGNSFLGMFGMSVDNFKFEKDPGTGSYNVKFNQGGS